MQQNHTGCNITNYACYWVPVRLLKLSDPICLQSANCGHSTHVAITLAYCQVLTFCDIRGIWAKRHRKSAGRRIGSKYNTFKGLFYSTQYWWILRYCVDRCRGSGECLVSFTFYATITFLLQLGFIMATVMIKKFAM